MATPSKVRRLGSLTALVAALALAGGSLPVSAATLSDGFTVSTSLTVTGIPASLTYEAIGGGPMGPGGTSGVTVILANITTNANLEVSVSGTDFSGPQTVGKAARYLAMNDASTALEPTGAFGTAAQASSGAAGFADFGQPQLNDGSVLYIGTAPINGENLGLELYVELPAQLAPGSYSGSVDFTFASV